MFDLVSTSLGQPALRARFSRLHFQKSPLWLLQMRPPTWDSAGGSKSMNHRLCERHSWTLRHKCTSLGGLGRLSIVSRSSSTQLTVSLLFFSVSNSGTELKKKRVKAKEGVEKDTVAQKEAASRAASYLHSHAALSDGTVMSLAVVSSKWAANNSVCSRRDFYHEFFSLFIAFHCNNSCYGWLG